MFFRILKTEKLNWFFPLFSLMNFISFTFFHVAQYLFCYLQIITVFIVSTNNWEFFFCALLSLHYFSVFLSVFFSKSIKLKFFPHIFLFRTTVNNHVWSHYMNKHTGDKCVINCKPFVFSFACYLLFTIYIV